MRFEFGMRGHWSCFGGYKMLWALFQFAIISATAAQQLIGCGGVLHGAGNISLPSYKDIYVDGISCRWTLIATEGRLVSLQVSEFHLESNRDYIYIYKDTQATTPYYKFTGSSHGSDERLTLSPKIKVEFHSYSSYSDSGFRIEFESVNATYFTACGGAINGSGEIASPNYPNHYPNNSRCIWRLTASAGLSVALRVIVMKREQNYDFVEVYNVTGQSNNYSNFHDAYDEFNWYAGRSGPLWTFRSKPSPYLGSTAVFSFTSDNTISDSGFRIEFTSINTTLHRDCGGELQDSGTITSPNYPNHYPNNCLCIWRLRPTPGRAISLRLVDFNTELGYDYLLVFRSADLSRGLEEPISGVIPGEYKNKPVELGNIGALVFRSDITESATGFRIEFTSTDLTPFTDCGGKLYGSGYITSPNYPYHYNNKSLCTWNLTAEAGRFVLLHVVELNTENYKDSVSIFNGTNTKSQLIYRFSGSYNTTLKIVKVLVRGTHATILFQSDTTVSDTGFRIQFRSADVIEYTGCGGELRGSGNITSPNYPDNYPNNSRCTWTLLADAGHVVSLRLIEFNTEYDFDVVSIYNGSLPILSNSSYNYTGYHGERVEPITFGASVTVVFTSDISESASGFKLEFQSVHATNNSGNTRRKPCLRRSG